MPITLRENKGTRLTKEEIDANFSDLDKRSSLTRSALVTAVASGAAYADGQTVIAGGLPYKWQTGATVISDLPGFVPAGDVMPDHWGTGTGAIGLALAAYDTVYLSGNYTIAAPIPFKDNNRLIAKGRAKITLQSGARFRFCTVSAKSNILISGIEVDGNQASLTGAADVCMYFTSGCSNIDIDNCIFRNLSGTSLGAIVFDLASYDCSVRRSKFYSCRGTNIGLSGAFSCTVDSNVIDSSQNFGIRLGEAAYRNTLSNNKTRSTGIEGIGLTSTCYENQIIGNHCMGAGDNGISISGYRNVCANNICRNNSGAGIGVWGMFNTIVGNSVLNNNQSGTVFNAGILILSGYGGTGQYNTIAGNFCDDEQATPTQAGGIRINVGAASTNYTAWASSTSFASGAYCIYGLNLYQTTAGGTTGATPPTHTSGSVSDGAVTWAYVNSYINAAYTQGNRIANDNVVLRLKSGATPIFDIGNWTRNTYGMHDAVATNVSLVNATGVTIDNTVLLKKYERIEVVLLALKHGGASTSSWRFELSGDNGSTWTSTNTVSPVLDSSASITIKLTIDGAAFSSAVRVTASVSGSPANDYTTAFVNTVSTGAINAIRVTNSAGYSLTAGTYSVIGIGPVV